MLKDVRMLILAGLLALGAGAVGCGDQDGGGAGGWDVEGPNNEPGVPHPSISTVERVVWPSVVPGAQDWPGDWKLVEVRNAGGEPLKIRDIKVQGSTRFRVTLPDPQAQERVEEDKDTWAASIEPGGVMPVRVWFAPRDLLTQFAALVLESNDPEAPTHSVELVGNADARCLAVQPADALEFGEGWIGLERSLEVVLENCGLATPLTITGIRLSDDSDEAFTLQIDAPADEVVLEPGEMMRAQVRFRPEEERGYQGEFVVDSDDAAHPELRVPIRGQGVELICPTASATARIVQGEPGEGGTTLEVPLMRAVRFDASPSHGPQGEITRFEWTILSSPEGSRAVLSDAEAPNPTLMLDMIGVYKVALRVYDEREVLECDEPLVLTIHSVSGADVTIHLAWETLDAGESSGADMDLHYRHPNATEWRQAPWDCYYANKHTPWGANLMIDSLQDRVPEVIQHSDLEDLTYRVGVNYYHDHQRGPGVATVRIFVHDVEVFVMADQMLTGGQFWEVATVDGGSLTVSAVDEVHARAN